ncbi:MAG: biotin--[acetyl-CoA-carboxylase] ligase [Eubacterium sp.]|nr:biotin--[acetyl-CoA-carboxylase] ligase [Eubacterium sp.]
MSLELSEAKIKEYLKSDLDIHFKECVTSTNTVLVEMAKAVAKEGTVLIANEQTAGKGRTGKSFYSPEGTGVYLSILVRPNINPEDSLFLTTIAAVATAKAIEDVSDKEAKIKWVNDVYVDGKKVCGILTESALSPTGEKLDYAVVGIGINISPPEGGFPDNIKNIATSVFDKNPDSNTKGKLVAHLLDYFMDYYMSKKSENHLEEYINRSNILGDIIIIEKGNMKFKARAIDIDSNCRLIVEDESGNEYTLNSGEVSIDIND